MFDIKNFQPLPPVNRLIGEMPKIGIRPVIDGRRKGVRESLGGSRPWRSLAPQLIF